MAPFNIFGTDTDHSWKMRTRQDKFWRVFRNSTISQQKKPQTFYEKNIKQIM